MSVDDLFEAARVTLQGEYQGYDPAAGRARLEDEAVHDAVDPEASTWVEDWSSLAACSTTDPDELFVQGTAQTRAKSVCAGCLVRTECLADALDNRVEFGVWGGMTERERRALLRRRPTVTSWRQLLQTARTQYEQAVTVDATPPPSGEMGDVVDKALEWTA